MFRVNDNNISLIRGDSGQFSITVTDMNGKEVALNDDDVLTFTVRRTVRNPNIVLQKIITGGELTINPSDTEGLSLGAYIFDVVIKRAVGYVYTFIPPHEFCILDEGTY